jgi:hypothetical protein
MRHVSTEGYLCRVLALWQDGGRWKIMSGFVLTVKRTRMNKYLGRRESGAIVMYCVALINLVIGAS